MHVLAWLKTYHVYFTFVFEHEVVETLVAMVPFRLVLKIRQFLVCKYRYITISSFAKKQRFILQFNKFIFI